MAPGFHEQTANVPHIAAEFAKLCEEAAGYGADIVLEIMPWSNVRTIETGLEIVRTADQPNGGLLIDIWHLARGHIPFSDIRKIPARFIKAVEVDDAPLKPPVDDLWEDTIHYRELPGEGGLDVPSFLREVRAAGYNSVYGTEILSASHRKLRLDEMAKRVFDSTMAQFAKI